MKGVIFNLFESFVIERSNDESYERIYADACPHLQTQEPFVGPGTYPDVDFLCMVQRAVDELAIPIADAVRAFGEWSFPRLVAVMPECVFGFSHPKYFLMTVHDIIHVEVKKLMPDARTPYFRFVDLGGDSVEMIYQSPRELYDFVDGILDGAAAFFGYRVAFQRELIELNGAPAAKYMLHFSKVRDG